MNKVDRAHQALGLSESILFHSIGEYSASDVEKTFLARIEKLGFSSKISCTAAILSDGGVMARFIGEKGNDAVALFHIEDDKPKATIVPTDSDDKVYTLDLSALGAGIETDIGAPNLLDLSWLNKSTLKAILDSGNIKLLENDIEYRSRSGNPLKNDSGYFKKLPTVKCSDCKSNLHKRCMELCKRLGWIRNA